MATAVPYGLEPFAISSAVQHVCQDPKEEAEKANTSREIVTAYELYQCDYGQDCHSQEEENPTRFLAQGVSLR